MRLWTFTQCLCTDYGRQSTLPIKTGFLGDYTDLVQPRKECGDRLSHLGFFNNFSTFKPLIPPYKG